MTTIAASVLGFGQLGGATYAATSAGIWGTRESATSVATSCHSSYSRTKAASYTYTGDYRIGTSGAILTDTFTGSSWSTLSAISGESEIGSYNTLSTSNVVGRIGSVVGTVTVEGGIFTTTSSFSGRTVTSYGSTGGTTRVYTAIAGSSTSYTATLSSMFSATTTTTLTGGFNVITTTRTTGITQYSANGTQTSAATFSTSATTTTTTRTSHSSVLTLQTHVAEWLHVRPGVETTVSIVLPGFKYTWVNFGTNWLQNAVNEWLWSATRTFAESDSSAYTSFALTDVAVSTTAALQSEYGFETSVYDTQEDKTTTFTGIDESYTTVTRTIVNGQNSTVTILAFTGKSFATRTSTFFSYKTQLSVDSFEWTTYSRTYSLSNRFTYTAADVRSSTSYVPRTVWVHASDGLAYSTTAHGLYYFAGERTSVLELSHTYPNLMAGFRNLTSSTLGATMTETGSGTFRHQRVAAFVLGVPNKYDGVFGNDSVGVYQAVYPFRGAVQHTSALAPSDERFTGLSVSSAIGQSASFVADVFPSSGSAFMRPISAVSAFSVAMGGAVVHENLWQGGATLWVKSSAGIVRHVNGTGPMNLELANGRFALTIVGDNGTSTTSTIDAITTVSAIDVNQKGYAVEALGHAVLRGMNTVRNSWNLCTFSVPFAPHTPQMADPA